MQEIFKDIEGYKGLYQVSDFGQVKSFHRGKEMILIHGLDRKGYHMVSLCNGNQRTVKVHQLVAIAFLNHVPCGMKLVVDHIDFNRANNHLSNLRIITNRENTNKKNKKSSSEYTGVSWDKMRKKWLACIKINNKTKYLGHFYNEIDASIEYQYALAEIEINNI